MVQVFQKENFGVCCLGNEIPKWFTDLGDVEFSKLFHNNPPEKFSMRIKLHKSQRRHTILGFAVCVVVEFKENKWKEFKLLCQPHYVLNDGRLLSWDFYRNYNYKGIEQVLNSSHQFSRIDFHTQTKFERHSTFFEYEKEIDVLFDFLCVDDNYEPLRFCNIKKCGIHLIFEDDTIDNIVPEPCIASGQVHSAEQEKEDNETHSTLKNSFYL